MSKIPKELFEVLSNAEASINAQGELTAENRLIIHEVMEKLLSQIHENAGHYTRAKLAIACAYSSLYLLESHAREKCEADFLLKNSVETLSGHYEVDKLENENEILYARCVDMVSNSNFSAQVIYASFACNAAANTVLYDNDFASLGVSEKIAAPEDWDASFYSSIAHCGAATWEGTGDNDKRKKFWVWYLNAAIPYAWDTNVAIENWPPINWQ
jgi:hypothetical protein